MYSSGLQWTPMDSDGFCMDSDGLEWILMGSIEFDQIQTGFDGC